MQTVVRFSFCGAKRAIEWSFFMWRIWSVTKDCLQDGQKTGLKIKFGHSAGSAVLTGKLHAQVLGCETVLTRVQTNAAPARNGEVAGKHEQHLNLQLKCPAFSMQAETDLNIRHEFAVDKNASEIVLHLSTADERHPDDQGKEYAVLRCRL